MKILNIFLLLLASFNVYSVDGDGSGIPKSALLFCETINNEIQLSVAVDGDGSGKYVDGDGSGRPVDGDGSGKPVDGDGSGTPMAEIINMCKMIN